MVDTSELTKHVVLTEEERQEVRYILHRLANRFDTHSTDCTFLESDITTFCNSRASELRELAKKFD